MVAVFDISEEPGRLVKTPSLAVVTGPSFGCVFITTITIKRARYDHSDHNGPHNNNIKTQQYRIRGKGPPRPDAVALLEPAADHHH
jgi:hypothetical protein